MTPEQPKYVYTYTGTGVVSTVSNGKIDGGPTFEVVIPSLYRFRGIVESEDALTDDQVRGKIPTPFPGFIVADVRGVSVELIKEPLPDAPEKPRPDGLKKG